MLGVHGVGEICRESIQRRLNRGNFLIADLDLTGKPTAGDLRSDVRSLGKNMLQGRGGGGLGVEPKTLFTHDARRAAVGSEGQAAMAGVNFGNIHEVGKLIDELLALVDKRYSALFRGHRGRN